jgi:hypothetical protein
VVGKREHPGGRGQPFGGGDQAQVCIMFPFSFGCVFIAVNR